MRLYKAIFVIVALLLAATLYDSANAEWAGNGWKPGEFRRSVGFQIDSVATSATVADNKAGFVVPAWLDGAVLETAIARVYTPGSGAGTLDMTVVKRTTTSDATMYSTTVKTGYTSATGTLTVANATVASGDTVLVHGKAIHGTASKGLWLTLTFIRKP